MSSSSPKRGTRSVGPYRLEALLAVGGMSEIYRARDERLGRVVAMKRVHVSMARAGRERERLWREARATACLDHPTIVRIYDMIESGGDDWMVMEYVEGSTLRELLQKGPLEVGPGTAIFRQIAAGLAEAHAQGVLHRDLKPSNVMITPSARVKILDFGLARRILPGIDEVGLTLEGVIGTPQWMSPEQAMSMELDPRSDLFSFGTLLYEAVTGENPFDADGVVPTLQRVCCTRQVPAHELNPQVPGELSRLIDALLEKDPGDRPKSARAVGKMLDSGPRHRGVAALTLPVVSRSAGRKQRDRRPTTTLLNRPRVCPPTRPASLPSPGRGTDSSGRRITTGSG